MRDSANDTCEICGGFNDYGGTVTIKVDLDYDIRTVIIETCSECSHKLASSSYDEIVDMLKAKFKDKA